MLLRRFGHHARFLTPSKARTFLAAAAVAQGCRGAPLRQSCVEQLCRAAEDPNDVLAVLREVPDDVRDKLTAAVLRKQLEDHGPEHIVDLVSREHLRAICISGLSRHFQLDVKAELDLADRDQSGTISRQEFKRYIAKILPQRFDADVATPSAKQLATFALNSAIPMMVFGCLDNSIMIVGGEAVDDVIGSTFRLSTLACAALANTFADVLGISIGNAVEALTGRLGLQARLSPAQAELPIVRRVGIVAASIGITVGCLLGMTPLLFIDHERKTVKEALARIETDGAFEAHDLFVVLVDAGVPVENEDVLQKALDELGLHPSDKIVTKDLIARFAKLRAALVE